MQNNTNTIQLLNSLILNFLGVKLQIDLYSSKTYLVILEVTVLILQIPGEEYAGLADWSVVVVSV